MEKLRKLSANTLGKAEATPTHLTVQFNSCSFKWTNCVKDQLVNKIQKYKEGHM